MKLAILGILVLAITFFMRGQAVPIMLSIGVCCILVGIFG